MTDGSHCQGKIQGRKTGNIGVGMALMETVTKRLKNMQESHVEDIDNK